MKYIRTLQNLKKIMDNAPEYTIYTKEENKESYSYTDDNISFSIEIENEKMQVLIQMPCMFATLDYLMENGEWELDVCCCIDMAKVNRHIRNIVKRIKEGEYIPVVKEETTEEMIKRVVDSTVEFNDMVYEKKQEILNEKEETEKAEQLSEAGNAQPNHINQDNYTLSFDNMEEAYNQEINNEGSDRINFPKKRRMVKSATLEKAIQEFIFKVKDGEIQRNTDNFYQVLKDHDVNRIIELPEWDYCEIICTVPDNNKRYVIELGYDDTTDYNEVINRIDYHVNSR